MNVENSNFYDQEYEELGAVLHSWGEPSYRLDQIWSGVYQRLKDDPAGLSNVPKSLRIELAKHFTFSNLLSETTINSKDNQTSKSLFRLADDQAIETVLMRYKKRRTLCISTQAGCARRMWS
jgi:23S rRNA (adenine2503-C2)-methyltransferase